MILHIFTDGGARGNPGPAAVGVVIKNNNGNLIKSLGKRIGETTNNVAEYSAVIEALQIVRNQLLVSSSDGSTASEKIEKINFFLDSSLVVNQLNGLFKVKDANLRNLLLRVRELENEAGGNISYTQIPREKNWQADELVNQALDA